MVSTSADGARRHKAIPMLLAAMPGYSVATLLPVPFLYFAATQRSRSSRVIALTYSLLWVVLVIALATLPDTDGWSTLGGFYLFALATVGTTHAFLLRQSRSLPDVVAVPVGRSMPISVNTDPTVELRHSLGRLRSRIPVGDLPAECRPLLDSIYRSIDEVASFVALGGHADTQVDVARSMVDDYLPTSIDTYLRLPGDYARTSRNADGKTADEELRNQLSMLQAAAAEATRSMYRDDAQRLEQQSLFLQSKFGRSELDLP